MTPAGGWRLLARAGDGSRDARLRPSTHLPWRHNYQQWSGPRLLGVGLSTWLFALLHFNRERWQFTTQFDSEYELFISSIHAPSRNQRYFFTSSAFWILHTLQFASTSFSKICIVHLSFIQAQICNRSITYKVMSCGSKVYLCMWESKQVRVLHKSGEAELLVTSARISSTAAVS